MAILVAHILVDHISFFSEDFKGLVTRHIPHQYSAQMSQNSEVVSVFTLVDKNIEILSMGVQENSIFKD